MRKILIASAFSILFFFSSGAYAANDLTQCNSYAQDANSQLPMQMDAATIWTGVQCLASKQGIVARYSYALLLPEDQVTPSIVEAAVADGLHNSWCTTPELRQLLDDMSIEAAYSFQNGKYITSIRVSKDLC